MKKINVSIKMLAALLMAGAAMTACTNDDNIAEQQPNNEVKTYNVVINASKGDDATTRALGFDGTALKATWMVGDQVIVRNSGEGTDIGTLTVQSTSNGGLNAVLKGKITGSFTDNVSKLDLHYCLVDGGLNSQDGTLTGTANSIDKVADYAKATVTVTDASTTNITTSDATFENQRAILKLTMTDKDAPLRKMNFSRFRLTHSSYDWGDMTSIPASTYATNGDGVLYVAISPIASGNLSLQGTLNDKTYTYTKSDVTIEAGKIYNINVKLTSGTAATSKALSAVTSNEVGWRLGKDGVAYSPTGTLPDAAKPIVAIIAYAGAAGSVENGNSSYHGLAIALNNCKDGSTTTFAFCDTDLGNNPCRGYQAFSNDIKDGIAATSALHACTGHTHPAVEQAISNNGTATPTGTSGWFLPSIGQWNLIVKSLAGSSDNIVAVNDQASNNVASLHYDYINPKLIDFGEGLGSAHRYYTTTEADYQSSKIRVWSYNARWGWMDKGAYTYTLFVRAVLAF